MSRARPDLYKRARETPRRMDESQFIRGRLFDQEKSAFQKYRELVFHEFTWWKLVRYEFLTTFIAPLGGALGLVLRRRLFRALFRHVGKGTIFGSGLTLRHADRISLGDGVMLDAECLLDARGAGEAGIVIGDRVIVNRRASIQAKVGHIEIGRDCNIGAGVQIISQSPIVIEENVSVAGRSIIAGGRYVVEQDEERRGVKDRITGGAIRIGRNTRIGMAAIIQDGVTVGENAIVAPGAAVFEDVPPDTVVWGNPARAVRWRPASDSVPEPAAVADPFVTDSLRPDLAEKRKRICEYIENDLFIEFGPDGYRTGESLLDTGVMDSLALVRLMLWIEETFGVDLDFASLDTSDFDSVDKIVARLSERKEEWSPSSGSAPPQVTQEEQGRH